MTEDEPSPVPSAKARVLLLSVVLVITCAVFARSLSGELVYDDLLTVARNPRIASLERVPELFSHSMWDFASAKAAASVGFWRPLASLALALGWMMGGTAPLAYHVLSLAFHLCATAAAFVLALRLSRNTTIAFFTALLFGLHPAHVESTAWISAINDPMFGCLALLSLSSFVAWRDRGSIGGPWLAGVWMLLALLSKELAVGILPAALAIDFARSREPSVQAGAGKPWHGYVPLLIAFGVYWLARVFVFGDLGAGFDRTMTNFGVSTWRLLLLRVELLGDSLRLLVWPTNLKLFHPFVPGLTITSAGFLVPLAFCLAWLGSILAALKLRQELLLAGLLFAPAALVPLLVRVEALGAFPLSERYLYLACFGFALAASVLAARLLPVAIARTLLAVAAALCAWRTYDRIGTWSDEERLLRTAVAESPIVPYVHWELGRILLEKYRRTGDVETLGEAHDAFERALDLSQRAKHGDETLFTVHDDFLQASVGLGWCSLYEAEIDHFHSFREAVDVFKLATSTYPDSAEAWTGLGVAQTASGDFEAAQRALEKAIDLDPLFVEARADLGEMWMKRGKWAEARAAFEQALALRPEHVDYLLGLAGANERGGDDAAALAVVERALAAAPGDSRPYVLRGILAAKKDQLDLALAQFDRAIQLRADDAGAWLQKGKVLLKQGAKTNALTALQRASDLSPNDFEANYNAGVLLAGTQGLVAAMPYLTRAYEFRPNDKIGKALRDWLLQQPLQSVQTIRDLATSDADRNDPDGALQWIEKALAIQPKYGEGHYLKAGMLGLKGDREGALRELKLACEYLPDSAAANQKCGALLAEMGDKQGAIDYFGRALAIAEKAEGSSADVRQAIEALRAKIAELKK